jgi:hypothetical protein
MKSKLSQEDQRKFAKCDKLVAKGLGIIGYNPYVPVPMDKKSSSSYNPQNHQIAAYYLSHLDASLNFKYAIELKYEVLDKNLKAFWKAYKGDKKSVKWIIKVDDASFDSLEKADKIRQEADLQLHIVEKIPMLKQAEKIEEDAEFRMEKVLFICQNLPTDPIPEWLASSDTLNPFHPKPVAKNNPPRSLLSDSVLNAIPVKDTSLYSLLHISEQQVDLFNDFLLEKFPNQVESYVLNYEQMSHTRIDSLQEVWNNFVLAQYVTSDTSFSHAVTRKNSPVQAIAQVLKEARIRREQAIKSYEQTVTIPEKETSSNTISQPENSKPVNKTNPVNLPDFFYRVQIAACRDELSTTELKNKYSDSQNIVVTYEDDWYKYAIGNFSDYKSARELKDNCKINGAFVVAYLNGKRIKITTYIINKKHP